MAFSKITLNGTTLVDMTDATAGEEQILSPYTAYGADGQKKTGTVNVQPTYTATAAIINDPNTTYTIKIGSGSQTDIVDGGVYTYKADDTIIIRIVDGGKVYYDGVEVANNTLYTVRYTFTAPSVDLQIECGRKDSYGSGSCIWITENVPQSGGDPAEDIKKYANGTLTEIDLTGVTSVVERVFCYRQQGNELHINAPDLTTVEQYAFWQSTKITSGYFPKVRYINDQGFYKTSFVKVAFPSLTNFSGANNLASNTALIAIDLGQVYMLTYQCLNNCSKLTTIVLRSPNLITAMENVNALNGTPFASGGSGGTIYIPKSFYDRLGTGSSQDYKAATNWSTLDSYGTITWAQIEGSYYETHYADDTEVTT